MDQEPVSAPVAAPAEAPRPKSSFGTLVSLFLIIVVIIVGALYLWGQRIAQDDTLVPPTEATTTGAGVNVQVTP